MRRHGLAGREDLLVATCLRNPTLSPLLEGGLAPWLLAIAREGGATAAVRHAALGAASTAIGRRNDRQQIASVLGHLAVDGDRTAARALLRMVDVNVPCETVAVGAIWALGETGWRRVIRSYGRRWREASRFDWGWIVAAARREVGARRLLWVLRDESRRSARLRPLAEMAKTTSREQGARRSDPAEAADLETLERLVRSRRRRGAQWELRNWVRDATKADRDEAWRRLLAESDPQRLVRRLGIWDRRRPPFLHRRLFELARHPRRLVRINATGILSRFRDARVREFALRMLRDDPLRALDSGVLDLLELNARDEYAALIGAALPRRASQEVRHSWVRGVLHVVEPLRGVDGKVDSAKPRQSAVWTPLLVRAMEISPCRACREWLLRRLVERGAATDAMLREALLDANSHVREVAREALRKLRPRVRARPSSR